MNNPFDNKDGSFLVLINDEEQYSLWPAETKIPAGWRSVHQGLREQCLEYIDRAWTDMRPRVLRTATASA